MTMIHEPLEAPGTIAVIGAGAAGLEAALYGRCLGYDVTVLEQADIGQTWRGAARDQPLPFLPDRGLSNLAMTAVKTQHEASGATPRALPTTIPQWVDEALEDLASSDLLAGRVRIQCQVTAIALATSGDVDSGPSESTAEESDPEEATPVPDFLLQLRSPHEAPSPLQVEAVIDTTNGGSFEVRGFSLEPFPSASEPDADFRTATPYFYRLRQGQDASVEADLSRTRDQIRRLFAMLGDRQGLDLYRPFRM